MKKEVLKRLAIPVLVMAVRTVMAATESTTPNVTKPYDVGIAAPDFMSVTGSNVRLNTASATVAGGNVANITHTISGNTAKFVGRLTNTGALYTLKGDSTTGGPGGVAVAGGGWTSNFTPNTAAALALSANPATVASGATSQLTVSVVGGPVGSSYIVTLSAAGTGTPPSSVSLSPSSVTLRSGTPSAQVNAVGGTPGAVTVTATATNAAAGNTGITVVPWTSFEEKNPEVEVPQIWNGPLPGHPTIFLQHLLSKSLYSHVLAWSRTESSYPILAQPPEPGRVTLYALESRQAMGSGHWKKGWRCSATPVPVQRFRYDVRGTVHGTLEGHISNGDPFSRGHGYTNAYATVQGVIPNHADEKETVSCIVDKTQSGSVTVSVGYQAGSGPFVSATYTPGGDDWTLTSENDRPIAWASLTNSTATDQTMYCDVIMTVTAFSGYVNRCEGPFVASEEVTINSLTFDLD